MITILYRNNPQSFFHALFPILTSKYREEFYLTSSLDYCMNSDHNKYLVLMSWFKYRYDRVEMNRKLLERLKNKYQAVIFFDDSDGADSLHVELIDLVDLYYKKQILVDQSHYLKPMYGRQLFSDYYNQQYGIVDEYPNIRSELTNTAYLNKLKLAWNLGASVYVVNRLQRRISYDLMSYFGWSFAKLLYPQTQKMTMKTCKKNDAVQARFGFMGYTNSIGYQRKLLLKMLDGHEKVLNGRISRKKYYRELEISFSVLSPFGWGEICHRDFEAFHFSSVLLKPNVDHILTWPDVFIPNETYIPIDWDGSNLLQQIDEIVSNQTKFEGIATNGFTRYYSQLEFMNDKVESFISEIEVF